MSCLLHLSLNATALALLGGILLLGPKAIAAPIFNSTGTPHPSVQFADLIGQNSVNAACSGIGLSGSSSCSKTSGSSITSLLKDVINILSIVIGIIAVIMIIVGGLKFITSGGEASKAASARNTIIYALVGVVIAILAQVLVHFVLNRANSASSATSTSTSTSTSTQTTPTCVMGHCITNAN
jgi:hypothetical protein